MRVDLHNHTPLCNHAEGEPAEYIEQAIEKGIEVFGFSDHAPMSFDPDFRMRFSEMELYLQMIDEVKEKYRDKIEILRAFEVDYLPEYHDDRVLNSSVDYLIGSIHFLQDWGFDNPEFIGRYETEDIDKLWKLYFGEIENMAKSGLFDIVGHIDLMKVFNYLPKENRIEDLAEESLKAIKKSGMAIEVNGAGFRKVVGEAYPSIDLLKVIYDMGIPITTSSDAHSPLQVGMFAEKTDDLIKKIGFKEVALFRDRKIEMIKI
jgi:histidinol-phosphatase (PHP family)